MEVGLGPGHTVLDRDPAPPTERGTAAPPHFRNLWTQRPMSIVDKWVDGSGCPLGIELGISPGNIVLDRDPDPPPKKGGHSPAIFGPCVLWPNSWMDQDATWYRGRPRPRRHCVRWDPAPLKGEQPPNFQPMSIVAKWLPMSATAELLLVSDLMHFFLLRSLSECNFSYFCCKL